MASSYVLAVDLGGTNLRVAAVLEDGTIAFREKKDAEASSKSLKVLSNVLETLHSVAARVEAGGGKISGVALGFPGIVDPVKGIVYRSPHFPDWKDLSILSFFAEKLPWPVIANNDANFAALGEARRGAGKGVKNFSMLTLGTGVGGGIIIDGKIFAGDRGFAGEFGHIVIESEGPLCACGSRGCLEVFVSAKGILTTVETVVSPEDLHGREKLMEKFGKPLGRLTVKDLHEAALDGDIFANSVFKKMGFYLGIGLASLVNTLGIERFVIGGGISGAWDFFIESTRKELAQRTYEETAKAVVISRALLGDDAALVGGMEAVMKR